MTKKEISQVVEDRWEQEAEGCPIGYMAQAGHTERTGDLIPIGYMDP